MHALYLNHSFLRTHKNDVAHFTRRLVVTKINRTKYTKLNLVHCAANFRNRQVTHARRRTLQNSSTTSQHVSCGLVRGVSLICGGWQPKRVGGVGGRAPWVSTDSCSVKMALHRDGSDLNDGTSAPRNRCTCRPDTLPCLHADYNPNWGGGWKRAPRSTPFTWRTTSPLKSYTRRVTNFRIDLSRVSASLCSAARLSAG